MIRIVIVLLFLPALAIGQKLKYHTVMPAPDSNVLLLSSTTPDSLVYRKAGVILSKNGYTVQSVDDRFLSISTRIENRQNSRFRFGMLITIAGGVTIIRGSVYSGRRNQHKRSAFYDRRVRGIPSEIAFKFMQTFADELKLAVNNPEISYGIE